MFQTPFSKSMSLTLKITLTALLIALAVVFQKVLAINYIAAVPFLRISFGGPAMIIFASIVLGPFYGLLVGAASDLLGFLIFDPKTSGAMPFFQITFIYALLGFASYFIYYLINKIKKEKLWLIIETIFMLSIATFVTCFIFMTEEIQLYSSTYILELWAKILIASLAFVFCIFEVIFSLIFYKKHRETSKISIPCLTFSLTIIELTIMVIFGTVMKGWAFGFQTYGAILLCQCIVFFINIPLNTVILTLLLTIFSRKYLRKSM